MNKEAQKKPILVPTAIEVMNLDESELDKMEKLQLHPTDMIKEKGSSFRVVATKVSLTEIRCAYKKVKMLHPAADHIVLGYALSKAQNVKMVVNMEHHLSFSNYLTLKGVKT